MKTKEELSTVLTIILALLKLSGVITWSWWIVLSPIILVILIWFLTGLGIIIFNTVEKIINKKL